VAGAECAARSTIRDSHDRWLDCLVGLRGFHFLVPVAYK